MLKHYLLFSVLSIFFLLPRLVVAQSLVDGWQLPDLVALFANNKPLLLGLVC